MRIFLCGIYIFSIYSCINTKNVLSENDDTFMEIVCLTPANDTISSPIKYPKFDFPIKINERWYLPFFNGSNWNLLYKEQNQLKTTEKNFFYNKLTSLKNDKSIVFIDFDIQMYEAIENGINEGVNVLIQKEIIGDKHYEDTIYHFKTYNNLIFMVKDTLENFKDIRISTKNDWEDFNNYRESVNIVLNPRYSGEYCYFSFSKKKGLIAESYCNSGDSTISITCNYYNNVHYQNFMSENLPKTKTINRNFFSKTGILSQYEKQGIQPITDSIFSFFLDTSSMLIYGQNYFHLSVNARIHTQPIVLPKHLQEATMIMKIPSLLRKEKSKFWVTPELYLDFGKVKQSEQLIFDFKAKKGTTWQVQKHKLFGGEITYIGKRDKQTYQYSIEPNETNGFPNLVGFEVNEDWGFTRFDFKNDDGEIVSYEMVKE